MEISSLKKKIVDNDLDQHYIFYGDESTVQDVYVKKIAEVSGSEIAYIDSLKEVVGGGIGFIPVKMCYVCIDPVEILKAKDLSETIEDISKVLKDNILIIRLTKVDKRSKLYNYLELPSSNAVEFQRLHPQVLAKYVKQDLDLSDRSALRLAEICQGDYGKCLMEMDKIKHYGKPAEQGLDELIQAGVIIVPAETTVFDFIDAVVGGHPKTSFDLLEVCKTIGEPALKLISLLFTSFRQVLQVQTCTHDIADTTGLSNWEIRKAQRLMGAYSVSEIIHALELLQSIEQGIKQGQIDEQRAVEYALVNIL